MAEATCDMLGLKRAGVVVPKGHPRPRRLVCPKATATLAADKRGMGLSFLRWQNFAILRAWRCRNFHVTISEGTNSGWIREYFSNLPLCTPAHQIKSLAIRSHESRAPATLLIMKLLTASLLAAAAVVMAAPVDVAKPTDTDWIVNKINADNIFAHLVKLNDFAKESEGNPTRVFFSKGHERTVEYLAAESEAAGWKVSLQEFPSKVSHISEQKLTAPASVNVTSFLGVAYTPSGKVEAPVALLRNNTHPVYAGCDDPNYKEVNVTGKIALFPRGGCNLTVKVLKAQSQGAVGAIIINSADKYYSTRLSDWGANVTIPVGTLPLNAGLALANVTTPVSLEIANEVTDYVSHNVFAETKEGNEDNVVLLGAHSDSVTFGAGINDDASGTVALLEVVKQLGADYKPKNKIRVAWWTAEEYGLLGSQYYVKNLAPEEKKKLALYLNFDMIGSPNGRNSIYNKDVGNATLAPGSEVITKVFEDFFRSKNIPAESIPGPYANTDTYSFIDIPTGGLITGGEGIKTQEQQAIYGGVAGKAYDACYHLACDDINNVNKTLLEQNTKAVAHVIALFGEDTSSVTGKRNATAA
ncbi:uncharacterized protein VTP21DRAFT_6691 [Calcarisporiella thermophila]|uniref:uncharacterized protein n=1 Tax=Calcarisporiella thermophila TaxID=911321 RepID=UPI0037435034